MAFLGLGLGSWILVLLGLAIFVYFYLTKEYGKWEKMGVASLQPTFFFGNNKSIYTGAEHMNTFHRRYYKQMKDKKVTIFYDGSEPQLYILDVELIKRVMIKDFDHFTDLAIFDDRLSSLNDFGLANAKGQEWKALKATISPAFSMRNLNTMAEDIHKVAMSVVDKLKSRANQEESMDAEELTLIYTMDCIAKVVFSMDLNSAKNPENEFVKRGTNFVVPWRFLISLMFPTICYWFNISAFDPVSADYFEAVAEKMIQERDKTGTKGSFNDVLALMMKVRDSGGASTDLKSDAPNEDGFNHLTAGKKCNMTNKMIAKTLMQFFIDGYDTTGSQISMVLYYLAAYPELQDRVFDEVEEVAERCRGQLTRENANELKYLDQFILEVGRLIAITFTARFCTKDWELPGHPGVIIPKGMKVLVAIDPVQRDPEYYDDPEEFNPDRFSPENKSSIKTGTYLPFGIGPRQCMGMKIATLESKILIFNLLRHFKIKPSEKTPIPLGDALQYDHIAKLRGGNWLKFVPRS